jgi:signal transduction histidine kinase
MTAHQDSGKGKGLGSAQSAGPDAAANKHNVSAEVEAYVAERTAELQQANSALERNRASLINLLESLPGLYLVLTPELKIVAASHAYLKATLTTPDIIGLGIFEVFPDDPNDPAATGVANLQASFDRVLQTEAPDTMAIQKYAVERADGSFEERHWSPINSPVFNLDRRIEYIVHRVEDVTDFVLHKSQSGQSGNFRAKLEQMEAEIFQSSQQVQLTNRKLEEANKELEAFSYSVSHDLRAPLRAVSGFAQAVIEDFGEQLPADGQRQLRVIRDSAEKMGELVDALLRFSQLNRHELTRQRVDMRALADECLKELKSMISDRRVDITVNQLPPCEGDRVLLKQVWVNLLSNAFKYSRKRDVAVVEIGCDANAGVNTYFVRDNGSGFDMRYANRLFGVFQRLHAAKDYEGTGVGLANVQRIIQRHGGQVSAEAELDRGATFRFNLGKGASS